MNSTILQGLSTVAEAVLEIAMVAEGFSIAVGETAVASTIIVAAVGFSTVDSPCKIVLFIAQDDATNLSPRNRDG